MASTEEFQETLQCNRARADRNGRCLSVLPCGTPDGGDHAGVLNDFSKDFGPELIISGDQGKMEHTVARMLMKYKPPLEQVSKLDPASFLGENHFHHALALERKRAERSGNTALLVKVEIRDLWGTEKEPIEGRIASLLELITRETDIKGWYKHGSIIGVIFTELGDSELVEAEGKILEKVRKGFKEIHEDQQFVTTGISTEYLSSTNSWHRNGNGHLRIEPAAKESPDFSNLNRFELMKVAIRQTWFLFSVDLLFISIATFLGAWAVRAVLGRGPGFIIPYLPTFVFSILLFILTLYVFDLYDEGKSYNPRQTAYRLLASSFSVFAFCTILFFFVPQWEYTRSALVLQVVLVPAFLLLWRTVYFSLFQLARVKLPTLVIGSGETGQTARGVLSLGVSPFEFKGFVSDEITQGAKADYEPEILGTTRELTEIIAKLGIRAIVLAIPRCRSTQITRRILEARLLGVEIMDMPRLYQRLTTKLPVQYMEDQWMLFSDGFNLLSSGYIQRIKHIFDLIFSGLLLFLVSPLMAITAIAIHLDSPGPIFYTQQRVGKRLKMFSVYKFRSMTYNAEEHGAKWAQKKDPRVTRVGRVIRLCRIDEIPQLWNVFKGDMSLVGPRPERPEFVDVLDSQIPYYSVRHTVAPGITGWAQINYPYGASIDDALKKLEYDLYYIKNMSILLDLKILLKTVGVVLLGQGAR
ncbi:MAG: sugar transferase [Syntrophobacteraceae bacterium]